MGSYRADERVIPRQAEGGMCQSEQSDQDQDKREDRGVSSRSIPAWPG
jgi:hypothetical protein